MVKNFEGYHYYGRDEKNNNDLYIPNIPSSAKLEIYKRMGEYLIKI